MATRVLEFSRAHPFSDPEEAGLIGKLEEGVTRAEALIKQQRMGLDAVHGATTRRKELRRGLQFQLLRYLIRVGESAARMRPELAVRFVLPELATPAKPFLASVKGMIELAEVEREFLTGVGLSGQALAELKREVAEFEEAIQAALLGRRDHIGASAELLTVTKELVELVRVIDALNQHRFRSDTDALATWDAASKVRAFRSRGEEPVVAPEAPAVEGLPPTDGGEVAPAA